MNKPKLSHFDPPFDHLINFVCPALSVKNQCCRKSGNVIETHEHAGDFKEW